MKDMIQLIENLPEDANPKNLKEVQDNCMWLVAPAIDGNTIMYSSSGQVYYAKSRKLEKLKNLRTYSTIFRLRTLEKKLEDLALLNRVDRLLEIADKEEVGFVLYTGHIKKSDMIGILSTALPLVPRMGLDSKMEIIETYH